MADSSKEIYDFQVGNLIDLWDSETNTNTIASGKLIIEWFDNHPHDFKHNTMDLNVFDALAYLMNANPKDESQPKYKATLTEILASIGLRDDSVFLNYLELAKEKYKCFQCPTIERIIKYLGSSNDTLTREDLIYLTEMIYKVDIVEQLNITRLLSHILRTISDD